MPTGYTANIKDGITFETFVMQCARAMGALVMMRDAPSDAPIPEAFEPSPYYADALAKARAELASLQALDSAQIERAAAKAFDEAETRRAVRAAEKDDLRAKYNAMIAAVSRWTAPTPDHVGFRQFMLDQLNESLRWDCDTFSDHPTPRLNGSDWFAEALATAKHHVAYHEEALAKEIDRTNGRNAWLKALRASLGA